MQCSVCNQRGLASSQNAFQAFVRQHAQHQGGALPFGDMVASAAKAVGIKKPCQPCEQRRHAMNQAGASLAEWFRSGR